MLRGFSYDTISGGFYSKDKLAGNGVGQISRNRVGTFTGNLTQEIFVVANNSMEFSYKLLETWKRTYPWKQADINLYLQRSSETTSIYRSIMLTNSNFSDFNILIRKTEGYQLYHNDVCWRWKLRMHHLRSLAILHYFISDPSPNKILFYY